MTKKLRKWRMLRISMRTHEMLKDLKRHTDVPMLEFVERVVAHIYGGKVVDMQALTFFLVYLDKKPTLIVAAKDAAAAETGLRAQLLGQGVKDIKAVAMMDARFEDVQRVGITAILSQLTQLSAILQTVMAKSGVKLVN